MGANKKEEKITMELALKQFDIRVARLKKLYLTDGMIDSVIKKEYRLIRKSGELIIKLRQNEKFVSQIEKIVIPKKK